MEPKEELLARVQETASVGSQTNDPLARYRCPDCGGQIGAYHYKRACVERERAQDSPMGRAWRWMMS